MARVEEQATEHFVRQVEQLRLQEPRRVLGCRERAARLERRSEVTAPDFERGREAGDPRGPKAVRARELGRGTAEEAGQAAPVDEKPARELGRGAPAGPWSEQDREELAVGQRLGPCVEQS